MKFPLSFCAAVLAAYATALGQDTHTPKPLITSTVEERTAAANSMLTKSITEVLLAAQSLKPGMTRADVLKQFTEEGGISTRTQHTYIYRGCPYIKIDVKFAAVLGTENDHTELMEDTIVKVSRPYLQWSIAD